ncbi:MAG: efflux RND transporter periplasmic adaptor subunit [Chthoniobacteraceae bacterium]
MKFPILIPAISLGLIAMSLVGCHKGESGKIAFDTSPVKRGDLTQYVTATGTLNAVVSVDVGSQISGRIQALYADYNSLVKKDELIALIDPATYQAAVDQANGNLENAKASLDLKRIILDRERSLYERKAAPKSDLDTADAEYRQAKATVDVNQALLAKANADLSYCRITAPVDGIVVTRKVDVGQTVAATMTTPVLFNIAQDIRKMRIITNVSEADIGQVKAGQSAEFTVDAFPNETFQGQVSQVRLSGTSSDNVVTYDTVVDVANPEKKLFPNMTAQVSILVAERKGVLVIPNAALRFTPPERVKFENADAVATKQGRGGSRMVYLEGSAPGILKVAPVKIGITDGMQTEVIEGLSEGAKVIISASVPSIKAGGGGPPTM